MEMTEGMGEIIGRRITGAFLRVRPEQPRGHLLLAFDDGTSYEFSSDQIIDVVGGLRSGNLENTAAQGRGGQLFCYEARFNQDRSEIVERQYEGEMDVKCDRVRHLAPVAGPEPAAPGLKMKSRWRRFMELLFTDPGDWE